MPFFHSWRKAMKQEIQESLRFIGEQEELKEELFADPTLDKLKKLTRYQQINMETFTGVIKELSGSLDDQAAAQRYKLKPPALLTFPSEKLGHLNNRLLRAARAYEPEYLQTLAHYASVYREIIQQGFEDLSDALKIILEHRQMEAKGMTREAPSAAPSVPAEASPAPSVSAAPSVPTKKRKADDGKVVVTKTTTTKTKRKGKTVQTDVTKMFNLATSHLRLNKSSQIGEVITKYAGVCEGKGTRTVPLERLNLSISPKCFVDAFCEAKRRGSYAVFTYNSEDGMITVRPEYLTKYKDRERAYLKAIMSNSKKITTTAPAR